MVQLSWVWVRVCVYVCVFVCNICIDNVHVCKFDCECIRKWMFFCFSLKCKCIFSTFYGNYLPSSYIFIYEWVYYMHTFIYIYRLSLVSVSVCTYTDAYVLFKKKVGHLLLHFKCIFFFFYYYTFSIERRLSWKRRSLDTLPNFHCHRRKYECQTEIEQFVFSVVNSVMVIL